MVITMTGHGTLVLRLPAHSVVVSVSQNVAAVSRDELAVATQAVADGDTDTTNQIEDEATRANRLQWRAVADNDDSLDGVTVAA